MGPSTGHAEVLIVIAAQRLIQLHNENHYPLTLPIHVPQYYLNEISYFLTRLGDRRRLISGPGSRSFSTAAHTWPCTSRIISFFFSKVIFSLQRCRQSDKHTGLTNISSPAHCQYLKASCFRSATSVTGSIDSRNQMSIRGRRNYVLFLFVF